MWLMLQQQEPDDFVIATGESHSVREFLELAFGPASLDWRKHVEIDPRYFRPSEVDCLRGDASKAQTKLGWTPKVAFTELVQMMVEHDFEVARRERALLESGRGDAMRGVAAR
jgi:GDPmannose 4,6-dehydratase